MPTYAVDVRVEVYIDPDAMRAAGDEIDVAARAAVDGLLQDAWDRTGGGLHTHTPRWHFEIPEHGDVIDVTGDRTAPTAPEEDPVAEPTTEQMSYKDALDYAIFAINTFMAPDASDGSDLIAMEVHSEEILTTLVDIRETVQGMPR